MTSNTPAMACSAITPVLRARAWTFRKDAGWLSLVGLSSQDPAARIIRCEKFVDCQPGE
jgi:hypothetical protein